ncbi:hypothetical protein GCM10010440_73560 [Kitasatospora cinereorecta]
MPFGPVGPPVSIRHHSGQPLQLVGRGDPCFEVDFEFPGVSEIKQMPNNSQCLGNGRRPQHCLRVRVAHDGQSATPPRRSTIDYLNRLRLSASHTLAARQG